MAERLSSVRRKVAVEVEPASPDAINQILKDCRVIAVVGLSSDPARPSYRVATYMQQQGRTIVPVNPNETQVLGERAYPSLEAVPHPVDLVDVFRKHEAAGAVVDAAIRV